MEQKRFLVLDDDVLIGEMLGYFFGSLGEQYQFTSDLASFYEAVDRWLPDIILIDLKLQDSDGISAFRELAIRKSKAPIIIMSGAGQRILHSAREAAIERGLDVIGTIAKPFDLNELKMLLGRVPQSPVYVTPKPAGAVTHQDLQLAISNRDIRVAVQPKFITQTCNLAGFEALARWQHTRLGNIPPDVFIPLAEQSGLIDSLTTLVFEQSAKWFSQFIAILKSTHEFHVLSDSLTLAVNLSAKSLANDSLFEWLYHCCQRYKLTPEQIVFELTESSAVQDTACSIDNLTRIRLQGFSLSIDDFGAGFSSLQQLVRLPFSEMKIDKSFVLTSAISRESRSVIQASVSLANSMAMQVTAEGVETEEILHLVTGLGCQLVQGYHTGRPMPPESVEAWFRERESQRRQTQFEIAKQIRVFDFGDNTKVKKIVQLVAALLDVPTVLVTVLDSSGQHTLVKLNSDIPEVPRNTSFCQFTVSSERAFVVENALEHELVQYNKLVTEKPGIRFYAGKSYHVHGSVTVGALCAIDYKPRTLPEMHKRILTVLAEILGREISSASQKVQRQRSKFADTHVRTFRAQAELLWEFCSLMEFEINVIIVKVSGLEIINREYGRNHGDDIIHQIQEILYTNSRLDDVAGRYRGAYFSLIRIKSDTDDIQQTAVLLNSKLDAWKATLPKTMQTLSTSMSLHICNTEPKSSFESIFEDAIDYLQG